MRYLVKVAAIAATIFLTSCATQQPTAAASCPNANHPKACCQDACNGTADHKGCTKACMKGCTKHHKHHTHHAKAKAKAADTAPAATTDTAPAATTDTDSSGS